ncbi:hypothetical protein C8J56DRAFT_1091666 [Mycena floridula]|nr:hypothetical protein C8J56DRAFT_1091666 [Mycena floridula]
MFFYKVDEYAAASYDCLIDTVFGLCFWEWFITLDFDFAFICGRHKIKWPMIFYFYARYAFLASLVTSIFWLNIGWQVNCQAITLTILLLQYSAQWASTVSLSIRTIMLWDCSRRIMVIIVPLIAFYMAAVCVGSAWHLKVVRSEHAFAQPRCVVLKISQFAIASLYTYTMVLDFIILFLTVYKLLYGGGDTRIRINRIPIFMLLFRDGLVYFVMVFIVTLLAVVCLMLNGNLGMVIGLHVVPSTVTVISSPSVAPRFSLIDQQIAAGRAVRHLYKYVGPVPETGVSDGMSLTIPDTPNIRTESEIP